MNRLATQLRVLLFITIAIASKNLHAQNIGINATGATPDASAMLDVAATNRGLLVPRVALTATNAAGPITSPTTSLLVYNTATAGTSPNNVVPGYYYWNGTAWVALLTGSSSNGAWLLNGNSGTNGATNFIGTTDNQQLRLLSNNASYLELGTRTLLGLVQAYPDYTDGTERVAYVRSAIQLESANAQFYKPKLWADANGNFRIKGSSAGTDFFELGATGAANSNNGGFEFIIGDDGDEPIVFKSYHFVNGMSEIMRLQSGRMAVGSSAFDATNPEKLLIDAGTTTSYNLMTGRGNINNYLQINVKNNSAGNNASSDVVATADNGTESTNYIDMGINSSGYTGGVMGDANDGYLYNVGQDLLIGTGTATKSLIFLTGGTTQAANERMRIDGNGNVGIGQTNPTFKLDVNGVIRTGNASATNGSLVFSNNTNANTVTLNTGVTSASYALTLPTSQGGLNTVLTNNGSGVLSWTTVAGSGGWSTLGNSGTSPATNFLGTTDNQPLVFRVNNLQSGRIETATTNNTAFGYQASAANTGTSNSSFGTQALLANTSGTNNTAIGYSTLRTTTSGGFNTAVGSASLLATTGGSNTGVGYAALSANSSGNNNTAIGYQAGNTITTGSNNTFVGYQADATTNNLTNATAIGYNAKVASSNSLILGGTGANAVNVGIGSNTFDGAAPEKLLVDAGTTTSFNAMVARGSINNYFQINVKNNSNGATASSDLVATADNGSETTNYIDMGINSSGYTGGVMGDANDAYLYNLGQDLLIGAGSSGRELYFLTGGTSQTTNRRMHINGTGSVTINNNLNVGSTTAANSTLQVTGSVSLPIITVTALSITPDATHHTILTNNLLGVTVNLPAASTVTGRVYVIKRIYGIGGNTVIDPNGAETIDGAATRNITAQYDTVTIQSNGTAWFVIAR
jgi:hypothetical protein